MPLESPITFDDSFRVTSVAFFTSDFSLLSWEFDNFYIYTIVISQSKINSQYSHGSL